MRIAKIDRTQLSSGTFLFWKRVASILDLVSRVVDTILSSDLYLFVVDIILSSGHYYRCTTTEARCSKKGRSKPKRLWFSITSGSRSRIIAHRLAIRFASSSGVGASRVV